MENNMNDAVVEATEIAESAGMSSKDIGILILGGGIITCAGYGIYQLGKKIVNKFKKKDPIDDFDDDDEDVDLEEEIHVVK